MNARAIWKGTIRFGQVSLPVKFYTAVEDRSFHFHLLHDQDLVRIRQRMVNPDTDEIVTSEQIRKGYEVERDVLVVLDAKDLKALEPEDSRDVDIDQFVSTDRIHHQWYERPYWLGPDGQEEEYFVLAEALNAQDAVGIARWVMRRKPYVGALRAEQGYLAMITLRRADEIIPSSELSPPAGRPLEKQELKLAGQLIHALESKFDPGEYHDEYRRQLLELIETKREGGTVEIEVEKKRPRKKSLAESLRASLQAVG